MIRPTTIYINKAKVVLFPIKSVRSVEINTVIKCGSWYENRNNLGIFHFLEHMLFHGTKKIPSAEAMMEFAKENGIYTNASTSGKNIKFYLNIPDINIYKGLEALEETIFNPIIPEEKIKNELKIITQEFLSKWDRPETRFFHQVDEFIFGKNHIYTRDAVGQIEQLEKISSSDLKNLHQQYFQPQNMIIIITGNIKNISKLTEKLTKILSKYQNTYKSNLNYPLIKPSSKKTLIYHDRPNQETISLIWILEKNKKNNRLQKISGDAFNSLFGGGIDSLLFKTFRLKYGLVYGIKSSISNHQNCSTFEISCQIDPKNSQQFLEILKKELKKLFNQIDQKMFNKTIKYLNYQTLMTYDSVREVSETITYQALNYKNIFLPEDYINLSKKINFQKTLNYFREKITWENKYIFRMTPNKPEH